MITDSDLRELLNYQAKSPVLSVFLNTEPEQGNAENHRLRLRNMLKEISLPDDIFAVTRYFDHEHPWLGRGVAVFSCVPENFFRAYPLAVGLRSRVRTDFRPYVKPLADLLDSYGGYGVVVVDKQGGRLFYFHLGELVEQEGVVGQDVRHTKRGGASTALGRKGGVAGQTNYTEEITERNIREVVEFATHFFAEKSVRRVLIGGTDENVALFRSLLPKSWQSLIVGTFPISMLSSHSEVLERAMEAGADVERRREISLVNAVVTNAAKGRGGVLRLADTFNAVRDGRVQTLIIRDGYRAPGSSCRGCGYLTVESIENCPFCGGQFDAIPDAIDLAVRQVMQSGGDVEVLHGNQDVAGFEQIGALLRY